MPYSLKISSYNLTFVVDDGVVTTDVVFDDELPMLVEAGVDEANVDDVLAWGCCCWLLLLLLVEFVTELVFIELDVECVDEVEFVWLEAPPLKQSAISTDSASPYLGHKHNWSHKKKFNLLWIEFWKMKKYFTCLIQDNTFRANIYSLEALDDVLWVCDRHVRSLSLICNYLTQANIKTLHFELKKRNLVYFFSNEPSKFEFN